MMKASLYVHIPFCMSRCAYCDFASTAGLDRSWQGRYLSSVLREWELYRETGAAGVWGTAYFGGGTPTYLDEDILEGIFAGLGFPDGNTSEFTVEANPGTLNGSKLNMLLRKGCGRLSVGAQSFDDRYLSWLGRKHTAEGFQQAWDMARTAGFTNMNLDLLYGLPDQSPGHWRETLRLALAYQPEHISLYQLNIEEGTPLAALAASGGKCAADEEICRQQYVLAHQFLTGEGYLHYEISNYAKPGFESRHNTHYWRNGHYLGLGAGASGYLPGLRYRNKDDLNGYIMDLDSGALPVAEEEVIDGKLVLAEELMLAFRLREGVLKKAFQERHGFSLRERFGLILDRRLEEGLLEEDEDSLRPTLKGWLAYNGWIPDFL